MGPERRAAPPAPRSRTHGRRWADDPDLRAGFEAVLVDLSRDLYHQRERCGWTLDQAADAAGVDKQTILDIEKTRGDPRLSTVMRLFFIYGQQLVVAGRPSDCSRPNRRHGATS
jgi:DNA-binding XRE family transcriptional regulator